MKILDHISESLEPIFWVKIHKLFDKDAAPGIFLTLDLGRKKFEMFIPDPQHWLQHSTLVVAGSHITTGTGIIYSPFVLQASFTHHSYLQASSTHHCHQLYLQASFTHHSYLQASFTHRS
jgi:hypothetical protein